MDNQEISLQDKTKSKFFYGYIIVIAAFITQVAMLGPHSSFGVFFKPLVIEFGWTRALISGAFSFSAIVNGLLGIVMGGLNDRLGPRVVMTLCGLLIGLGYLLMSQINAAWQLYLFYVLIIGIGMGGVYTPPISTVARWFIKRRSAMSGIVIAGGGTGALIAPPVINWFIFLYGWRNSYIIVGALVLVIVVLVAQFLRRDPTQMGLVPYGKGKVIEPILDSVTDGISLKETTSTRQFWMVIVMLFCIGFFRATLTVHIVPHITDLEISAATAANILAVMGGGFLIGSIVQGGFADRIGNRQAYIVCFMIVAAALFWLITAREVWMFYLFAIVFGYGSGGFATLHSPLVADLFGIRSHGLILGVIVFSHTIGAAVGPFIAGYVFDVTSSYQLIFLVCAALAVMGFILAVILRPIKRQSIPNY